MPPLVAIIGRPNVGKSTLFNRLMRTRRVIVDDTPGVTRDRVYGLAQIGERMVRLADTGGLDFEDQEVIVAGIRDQAITAVNEADVVVFVVDVRTGLTPIDAEIAGHLRRYNKPIVLALNKVDTRGQELPAQEFTRLGFEHAVFVSAEHGVGIGDLWSEIGTLLPAEGETEHHDPGMSVAVIGRPNVGKSSILNAILGDRRMIVSEIAGTTRDVVDTTVTVAGRKFTFLDTAGIRKKAAINERIEIVSSIKARETISRADCCILVINADEGVTTQDKTLAGMIDRDGSGCIIALNKWDLRLPRFEHSEDADRYIREVHRELQMVSYAPLVSTSALSGQRVPRLVDKLIQVAETQQRIIPAGELTAFINELLARSPVPLNRGKAAEIMRMTHLTAAPARFRLFVRGHIPENYLRFIERELRERFDLEGVPVQMAINRV